ncbi:hypothetical protein ACFY2Z_26535 [Streptomyces sp. NPDC001222]|uniref:hypothetical protein n=1 Tax=Streptomyces sp. NPDC001222 TaxID=3364548 RepID=UPI0036B3E8FC
MSERTALESAVIWHTLASGLLEKPLSADEANYVLARVVESLGEVLPLAIAAVGHSRTADLPLYSEAGRDIGAGLRHMRP